jgi:hypothetical protein
MGKVQTYWDGDTLMHHWYGGKVADEVAYWQVYERPRNGRIGAVLYDGLSESKAWPFYEKPSAEVALAKILDWQRG